MTTRRAIDEAKKGSAEVVILAIIEQESHHGYQIAKLIEQRTGGGLTIHPGVALRHSLPPRGPRLDQGALGREGRSAPALLLPHHRGRGARCWRGSVKTGAGSSPRSARSPASNTREHA